MKRIKKHAKVQNESKETNNIEQLAYIINSVDGSEPSLESKKIIHSYTNGEIDYETAKEAILASLRK